MLLLTRSLPMAFAVAKAASRRNCVYMITQMEVAIAFENQRRTDQPPMLNAWKQTLVKLLPGASLTERGYC